MEAAKILGCSYIDLIEHPRKAELMTVAFTYQRGTNDGEYLLQCTKAYWKAVKEKTEAIERARK